MSERFDRLYNDYLRTYRPWKHSDRPAWSYYYRPWDRYPYNSPNYDKYRKNYDKYYNYYSDADLDRYYRYNPSYYVG